MVRRLAGLALLLIATSSCEFIREPTAIDDLGVFLQVHAMLIAGSGEAAVLVTTFDGGRGLPLYDRESQPVPDASVLLIRGGDTVALASGAAGAAACLLVQPHRTARYETGCYAGPAPGGLVEAGLAYDLVVHVPGREPVRGRAVIPEPPVPITPAAGTRIFYPAPSVPGIGVERPQADSFDIRWRSAPGAGVGIHLEPEGGCRATLDYGDRPFGLRDIVVTEGDSVTVRIYGLACGAGEGITPDSVPGNLVLTMYDTAYAAYLRQVEGDYSSTAEPYASAGLTGAYGVFAGAARVRTAVMFVQEPPDPD